jgi:hypothetical protein
VEDEGFDRLTLTGGIKARAQFAEEDTHQVSAHGGIMVWLWSSTAETTTNVRFGS